MMPVGSSIDRTFAIALLTISFMIQDLAASKIRSHRLLSCSLILSQIASMPRSWTSLMKSNAWPASSSASRILSTLLLADLRGERCPEQSRR